MTTPLHLSEFVTMTLPFVGDRETNQEGFFSQRETGPKHPSRQRRVSPCVSLKNTNKQITNESSSLHD
ncbi:hypothetical protein PVE_R1G0764 [Pseudomonas veronii 1YdBTEX2]|uniref:Uncharacterized protein n=1 Tax=Pseudomonas veronii 1YdBTEX2 TaxID=1295141 RepID=A0A1D3JRL3_PSEVE|nr:hypothetical protein PVE_R1G0764 [Pseudomonas veronii 1YdBTEX2]